MRTNSSILLIGSGRMAKHLQHWNSLLEKPNILLSWNRKDPLSLLEKHLNECHTIWLAISDFAISSFYEEYLSQTPKLRVVHFSGALSDQRIFCAHPLMSFPHHLLPDSVYNQIHFVINGFGDLNDALPNFKNKFTHLNETEKGFYHALCVLAGNFPQLLWQEVAQKMKDLQLPSEALDLYIQQITTNYLTSKENAITGPIVRRDYITIEKNLASLDSSSKLKNIYSTFTKEFTT